MKKSMKLMAAAASLVMAVSSVPAVSVSANSAKEYSANYQWYNVVTKKYYNDKDEAVEASSASDVVYAEAFVKDYSAKFTISYPYYSSYTKRYYPTLFAAQACSQGDASKVIFGGPDGSPKLESGYTYYSTYTKRYYKTYAEALEHSNRISSYVYNAATGEYSDGYSYYGYYSTYTGRYYDSYSSALSASGGNPNYVRYAYRRNYVGSGDYYNSSTGRWYPTLAEALAPVNGDLYYVYYAGDFFYSYAYNGKHYATESEAVTAGGTIGSTITQYRNVKPAPVKKNSEYIYSDEVVYNAGYIPSNYYYYNGTWYYGNGYNYYLNGSGIPVYTNPVEVDRDAEAGVPYLKGYPKKNSWSGLSNYVKNRRSGSSFAITMNGCDTVPQKFLSNLKGKNVTVVFELSNGAKWTLKGTDIKSADSDVNIAVDYNADVISSGLIKKAKKIDSALTAAQISVAESEGDLGFKGNCTIKFKSDKAGCSAKAYLYNPDSNTLSLASKSVVDKNGYVSFKASKGGTYLVVVY